MNIVIENREDKSSLIKVTVNEGDYGAAVDKALQTYKRKANIPGFRPGMVPMGVINKMYRKGVVAEEAYRAASKACYDYVESEKIDIIGDIIPSEDQQSFDFENNKEHDFLFEIGRAPKVEIDLSSKDKVARYDVKVSDKMYNGYRTSFTRKFGKLDEVDVVTNDEAVSVTLENDEMSISDAYVGLISMSEEDRKPFIGKKVGDVMDVDVNELYKMPSQRAAILQVEESELANVDPKFKLTITKIRQFVEPTMNEEFFKMAFPDGSVADEKGFEAHINKLIARDVNRETNFVFTFEMRKMLMAKANLQMPEEFLKRWLFTINEGKFTMEQIETDFDQFLDMMKWNTIMRHYTEKFELKVTPEEAVEEAKAYTLLQFAQYGMTQVPDDMLTNYANQMLANKEEAHKIYDKLYEHKVIEAITPMVSVQNKEVTPEEFEKIVSELYK